MGKLERKILRMRIPNDNRYQYAGSLVSRLHRASSGEYIGYAQWTSRDQWERQRDRSDAELQAHRQGMRACCEAIEVLYEMDVTDDYLQSEVCGGGIYSVLGDGVNPSVREDERRAIYMRTYSKFTRRYVIACLLT